MLKVKKLAALAFLLAFLLPVSFALAKSGTVTASSLNIRQKASAESDVVGRLREGDTVTIKDSSGSWYKVSAGGKTGYVAKKYISVGSSSGSSTKSSSKSSSSSSSSSSG
ncbi:MAG: SH3 domain-containing protein, partial [Clostridia bacterium]|nr:SH3 domain-containing protein [Clostridia bacterium]